MPFNYQYPLSTAIYRFMKLADEEFATEIQNKDFWKGFKFFTFSDLVFRNFQ
ncbi:hypothetical protein AB4865_05015 [Capnocytophaga sp. ARDL2]|uniref:hypothetical protein n=1 Tax=Capnocytophaga sp. ARDL2 TaxID=3238809 RepID=UPI0035576106